MDDVHVYHEGCAGAALYTYGRAEEFGFECASEASYKHPDTMNMEIEHSPSSLASRYLNPAPPIGIPSKALSEYKMTDKMERQPAAGSAFDIEARMLREIEWRPPRGRLEPLISRRDALLPQFNSETAASRIPIGIWDKILGYLANEQETLGIAEEFKKNLGSVEDVYRYARYIKTIPRPRRSAVRVGLAGSAAEEGKQRSLSHVGTFAAMFAGGHLPRLSTLIIGSGEWTPGSIPQSVFLHLSSFHSITRLNLIGLAFPSITVLLRLVCAFDRLQELEIKHLRLLDTRVPPDSRRWAPSPTLKRLTFIALNWPDHLCTLILYAVLGTSGGSETVLFLLNAVSCSDLNQLLHHAGKALRQFWIHPLRSLSSAEPHSIQPLRVPDVDLSRNVGLRELVIYIDGDIPAALLERAETYGVIQQTVSSTCTTVLEKISIRVRRIPSATGPSIISHVLLALHRAICHPDHPLASEKYTSLKSVELQAYSVVDKTAKTQMEADWANLAPMWFPSFYYRGVMK
ncbi:hypothetical protein WOLCODRAFT_154083 [Wolfiporia cocos MD-104 SS10]|uniref:Uncharacterized protein n=1 Tax=Wolfiporia cocos (strain MD-104) TaxID=742152 RepID=A0A2H3JPC3_WOLCO|nr:hypothetical protein WOLCODRAFT_154083 [Wolfiporia cocos MD-104 SS10]